MMTNVEMRPELRFGLPLPRRRQLTAVADSGAAGGDEIKPGARFLDTAQRMWLPLVLLLICQVADLVTFSLAVGVHGASRETGPLRFVYENGGLITLAALKVSGAVISALVLALHPWRSLVTPRRLALLSAAVGVFGACTNIAAIW
jgi:hypothetical protein